MGQRELCKCLLILQCYSFCSCFINLINLYHVVVVIYWKCFCLVLFFFSCFIFCFEGCLSPFSCRRKSQLITCITTTSSMLLALLTTQTTSQTRGRILVIFHLLYWPIHFPEVHIFMPYVDGSYVPIETSAILPLSPIIPPSCLTLYKNIIYLVA